VQLPGAEAAPGNPDSRQQLPIRSSHRKRGDPGDLVADVRGAMASPLLLCCAYVRLHARKHILQNEMWRDFTPHQAATDHCKHMPGNSATPYRPLLNVLTGTQFNECKQNNG
jgi:hypothetical protein